MSQDTSCLSLNYSAHLLDAPYYAFDTVMDDWLTSSPDLTIATEAKPLFLTEEIIPGLSSYPDTQDSILPLLLSNELSSSWTSLSNLPTSSRIGFDSTTLAPPPSPSSFEPDDCSSPVSEAETLTSDADSSSQSPRSISRRASYRSSSTTSSRSSGIQHRRSQRSQAATPIKRRKSPVPHTEVEKRYRNSLNAEIRRLQMAVPHLATFHSEFDSGRPGPTKATIISSAVHYIKAIEIELDALRASTATEFSGKGI